MINQKILVTGASGFVGKSLCAELLSQGYSVLAAVRSSSSVVKNAEMVTIGEIDGDADWTDALKGVDVAIHLAARVHVMKDTALDPLTEFRKVNVEGTLNLAQQAAKVGIKRFVFVSSIKVSGEATEEEKPFTESDAANPQDAYGISKSEAEQGLLLIAQQTGMEVVIIRPPLVYGAGVKANFASMMRAVQRGIPLPLGAIHNKRSFVYVENLVSLILRCIDHPAAVNQVFLVSDGCDLSTTELLRGCAVALGVKARLLPVPKSLIEVGAALLGKRNVAQRLCGNLQLDITKARTLLGWTPPYTIGQGLRATAERFRNIRS
ncbi:SDR family oxidoreductase [Methylotenera sp.]|uniref:UDP-glucose 4-epimerase family protein n=2 Tax=Methylotenera sp. TaxID=2051956 RepID=UPI00272F06F4|nr:SDR family oxidoreductase [Methylotenera sp.]MDP2071944.1 SDR family oxidoreductase [Methylotenera sp.]MDP3005569.1 SDR family oxidoreductase [Methylotenera sp.]MDP3308933.1 SDR family oxidoreductase [Methylotenera sp.]